MTLVGHPLGAYVVSVVALRSDRYGASSVESGGRGTPDAFVGISGPYDLTELDVHSDLVAVLGGDGPDRPTAWLAGDPMRLVAHAPALPIALVHARRDTTVDVRASRPFAAALRAVGDQVVLRDISTATHVTVVDPTTSHGQVAVRIVIALALSLVAL